VFGQIATAVHARAVTVPVEALVPAGDGYQVFVSTAPGAHARPVTLGARTETLVEIVTGLAAARPSLRAALRRVRRRPHQSPAPR